MRLGNLIWNILNFILLLGVVVVLAWPIVGPSVDKNKFQPNRNSFIEHFLDKDKKSNTHKKQYKSKHPLGTDSDGKDKMYVISNATLRNIQ